MGDIKSAREIAMEKVENLESATEEERLRWRYIPEGEKLAVRYFKEGCNLVAELSKYEAEAAKYVADGAAEILIRNIDLPRNDAAKRTDKTAVENVYSNMRRIFSHYLEQGEQQRKQAYEALKTEVEARVRQAMQQQLGSLVGSKIDVERQPQFQEEWRKVLAQLGAQYYKLLDEYKRELSSLK